MRRLDQARAIMDHYDTPTNVKRAVTDDRKLVQRSLIQALQTHHPEGPWVLDNGPSERCAAFLRNFETIFTTNYDLLLYWVIAEHLIEGKEVDDGFRGYTQLTWRQAQSDVDQNVFYLHGALHIWEDGETVYKMASRRNRTLLNQLQDQLDKNRYPLFVSEGAWRQKRNRIRQSPYLSAAYAALSENDRPLVIYGLKLSPADKHIVDAIKDSYTTALVVTYWDGEKQSEIEKLETRAETIGKHLATELGRTVKVTMSKSSEVFSWT